MSQLRGCSFFLFINKPIVWLGDDVNSGFEQCLGLLFSNLNVLSESIVWRGGYPVLSKMTADCVAAFFESLMSQLCGLEMISIRALSSALDCYFQIQMYSLSRLCGLETTLLIQKLTADCLAVSFLNHH